MKLHTTTLRTNREKDEQNNTWKSIMCIRDHTEELKMLKRFINIICMVVIMTLMVACAEPYDNELSEEPYEEPEELIEEPTETVDGPYEDNSIKYFEDPVEITGEPYEDPSDELVDVNVVIEESYEITENTIEEPYDIAKEYAESTAVNLNVAISDFIQDDLAEYFTDDSALPKFCNYTYNLFRAPGEMGITCEMPSNLSGRIMFAACTNVSAHGWCDGGTYCCDLYDNSIDYCAASDSVDCFVRYFNKAIILATIMQQLGLLPTNCDSYNGEAHVFCHNDDHGHVYCEIIIPEYMRQLQQIDEIKSLCITPHAYLQNNSDYYTVTSFNGITIRAY